MLLSSSDVNTSLAINSTWSGTASHEFVDSYFGGISEGTDRRSQYLSPVLRLSDCRRENSAHKGGQGPLVCSSRRREAQSLHALFAFNQNI